MPTIDTRLNVQADVSQLQRFLGLLREVEERIRRIRGMNIGAVAQAGGAAAGGVPSGQALTRGAGVGATGGQVAAGGMPPGGGGGFEQFGETGRPGGRWAFEFMRGLGVYEQRSIALAAGFLAQRFVRIATQSFAESMWGGMAAEAAAFMQGSPFAATIGALQRRQIQELARVRAISQAGTAVGGGLMGLAGLAAMSGWGLPVAAGLAIAGLGATTGATLWGARAQAYTETEYRLRQAAVTALQQRYEARRGQIPAWVALARAGIGFVPGREEEWAFTGMMFGVEFQQALQMRAAMAQRGGLPIDFATALALQMRYGVEPGQIAMLTRAYRPGYGLAARPGTPVEQLAMRTADLEAAVQAGIAAGIAETDIPRYLQTMTQFNERLATQGIALEPRTFERLVTTAAAGGLRGRAAEAFPMRIEQLGMGVRQQLLGTLMPPDVVQNLMLAGAVRRLRPGQTLLDVLGQLEQPEFAWQALRGALGGMPRDLRALVLMQGLQLGLGPARGLAGELPRLAPPRAPGEDVVGQALRWAEEALGPVFTAMREMATAGTTLQRGVQWEEVARYSGYFVDAVNEATRVMRALADDEVRDGIRRMREELERFMDRIKSSRHFVRTRQLDISAAAAGMGPEY